MSASTLTIRLDSDLKREASDVVEGYGLDLSSVTRAFYTQIVRTGAIPLSLDYAQPNDESLEAIRETDEMVRTGSGKRYEDARSLIQAALS